MAVTLAGRGMELAQPDSSGGNLSTVHVRRPWNLQVGQLMVMPVHGFDPSNTVTVPTPAGWTLLDSIIGGSNKGTFVFYRIATAEDVEAARKGEIIQLGPTGINYTLAWVAGIYAFSGVDQSTPFGAKNEGQGDRSSATISALTTTRAGSYVFRAMCWFNSASPHTSPWANLRMSSRHLNSANAYAVNDGQQVAASGTVVPQLGTTNYGTSGTGYTYEQFEILADPNYVEPAPDPSVETATFGYTGAEQTFVVPSGITELDFECWGAAGAMGGQGNGASMGERGGPGGYVRGKLKVTPGETLRIYVGGGGIYSSRNGGWNGGGGCGSGGSAVRQSAGGATDIRRGGSALTDRVVVAGGGGGRESELAPSLSSLGGGLIGGKGSAWNSSSGTTYTSSGGDGGTQSAGGAGRTYNTTGTSGALGLGGNGGAGTNHPGGGGGGGYYGGGGGGGTDTGNNYHYTGGGGGGSSYTDPVTVTDVVHAQGAWDFPFSLDGSVVNTVGNGLVLLSWPNRAPIATGLTVADTSVMGDSPVDASWQASDPDGDTIVKHRLRYRLKHPLPGREYPKTYPIDYPEA